MIKACVLTSLSVARREGVWPYTRALRFTRFVLRSTTGRSPPAAGPQPSF